MKSQQKNITEEIERIKSLFTEERLYGNLVEQEVEEPLNLNNPKVLQRVTTAIKNASDVVKDKVLSIGTQGMKDRKKDRQGFGHMSTKEKGAAMRTQKTDQRNVKKKGKKDLAACNRGMKALQKYFLGNPNPKNRMTIETFKGNITGEDFKSRQDKVTGCTTTFKGQLETDKEIISNKTVTEWITDIIITGNNNHRKISKEAIKGTVGNRKQIKVKDASNKNIGIISSTETKNQYKLNGSKKIYFLNPGLKEVNYTWIPFILKALEKPKGKITVVVNTGKRDKYKDSFEFTVT